MSLYMQPKFLRSICMSLLRILWVRRFDQAIRAIRAKVIVSLVRYQVDVVGYVGDLVVVVDEVAGREAQEILRFRGFDEFFWQVCWWLEMLGGELKVVTPRCVVREFYWQLGLADNHLQVVFKHEIKIKADDGGWLLSILPLMSLAVSI